MNLLFGSANDSLNLAADGQVILGSISSFKGGAGTHPLHKHDANLSYLFRTMYFGWR